MSGFGRQVGPEGPPSLQQRFGNFSRPSFPPPPQPAAAAPSSPVTSLPFPRPTSSRSPRVPESIERPRGQPFVYQSSGLAASPGQSIGIARRPESALSAKSSTYVPNNFRPITRPQSFGGTHRIEPSQEKGNAQKPFPRDDFLSTSKPAAVTSFVASRGSNASLTAKFSRFQEPRRYKAPPSQPTNGDSSGYSIQTSVEYSSPPSFLVNNGRPLGPPRPKSPPLAFEGRDSFENAHPSTFGSQRSGYSSPVGGKLSKFPGNASTSMARQSQPFGVPHLTSYDPGRSLGNEVEDMQHPKRTWSPPMVASPVDSQGYNHFAQVEPERSSIPPPTLGTRSIVHYNDLDSLIPQRSLTSISNTPAESTSNRISSFPVTKRTRVSTLPSADEAPEEDLYSVEDDADREIQAKAKRLARFKKELSENFENVSDMAEQKFSAPKHEQDAIQRRKRIADDQSMEVEGNFNNINTSSDLDAVETSSIITGLCRDMCPESERAERERKGDLDQYERFEGDRNQTNKFLAVKKYTRTAEREASLIRPMEILQKTIDYLLSLLDQPYDDRFLGLYNFLWDRMRAIRMDLRMQHIFNQQAITMLEQMIRLHIAAMHELCEYTKGEGFSEGFDAHLNIEQMNKTSVELFQVYDDHRKKGLAVSTEKEFRGYYALLKLDKHPGYKVEPAELSLDLAKMTPDIRQTPEVLFARAVARACRTGNFIAFFRLARKATYLQACLMHAHFAKLRTQALASLHAGLQNNQGLPVTHVAKWLAMEDEDIESLLEYHGFLIKDFREPYMVKEGPFINADNDYPTKCSKLVHMKKSKTIVADVSPSSDASSLPAEIAKEVKLPDAHKRTTKTSPALPDRKRPVQEIDQEMSDSQAVSSPKVASRMPSMIMKTVSHKMNEGYKPDHEVFTTPIHNVGFSFPGSFEETRPANNESVQKPTYNALSTTFLENKMLPSTREISPRNVTRSSSMEKSPSGKYRALQERLLRDKYAAPLERAPSGNHAAALEKSQSGKHAASPDMLPSSEDMGSKDKLVSVTFGYTMESPISNMQVVDNSKDEELVKDDEHDSEIAVENYDEEVAEAKLKLIIRLWKRRTSKLKELRELRQVAACAALNSLSLGPPIRQPRNELSTANEFDIDILMMKRHEKYVSSWSRLNVSEVIADVLSRRNPDAKCICWKIILCSSMNAQNKERLAQRQVYDVGSWLFSKLMPCNRDDTKGDLLVSSPGMSIWKRWIADQDGNSLSCCLSVVKDVSSDNFRETESGTSAILFIVNPSSPWNLQKNKLHKLLELIPSGSSLPLLILGGSSNWGVSDASATITTELGLHEIDKSKVQSFSIVFLVEDQEAEQEDGFFSDTRLREGLSWLASESPPQPYIQSTKTRELVLARLNPSLDVLETMTDQDVGPNHCISVFNEALDWSLREINASAKENPIGWPCPEIGFLDDSCDEYMLVKWYLPSTGWSSAGKMGPLLHAIGDCKLPSFPNIVSWLHKGANSGDETLHLRSQLENCLITYLSQSSEMMGLPLAEKEANVMIQRCARLEILDSTYYIIPSWIKIFRRIFNWRLTRLSSGMHSTAYVHRIDPTQAIPDEFGLQSEFCLQSNVRLPYLYHPSLDEVIGLNTALDTSTKEERRQRRQQQEVSSQPADVKIQEDTNMCDVAEDRNQNDTSSATENFNIVATRWNAPSSTEMLVARKAPDDKLSKLLDECEKLQDNLDKKLYVYF